MLLFFNTVVLRGGIQPLDGYVMPYLGERGMITAPQFRIIFLNG